MAPDHGRTAWIGPLGYVRLVEVTSASGTALHSFRPPQGTTSIFKQQKKSFISPQPWPFSPNLK